MSGLQGSQCQPPRTRPRGEEQSSGTRGGEARGVTHWVGSLWYGQLPELGAFMLILMVTNVQCSEEVGEEPQDVDNCQLVRRVGLWRWREH